MRSKTQLQTTPACLRLLTATPAMALKLGPLLLLLLDPHHPHLPEMLVPTGVHHTRLPSEMPGQMGTRTAPLPLAGISQKSRQQGVLGVARVTRMMMSLPSTPCPCPQCGKPPRVRSEPATIGHGRWTQRRCQRGQTIGPLTEPVWTFLTASHRALAHLCQAGAIQHCLMAFYSLAWMRE